MEIVQHHRCQQVGGQVAACQDITARLSAADVLEQHGLSDAAHNLRAKAAEQAGRCAEVLDGHRTGWGLGS